MFGALSPQSRESFASILKAGNEAAALTRQMMAFSNRQLLQPTVFDLNDLLRDETERLGELITESIALSILASPAKACVFADRAQMEQVVHSLVTNAREAMANRGKLTLATSTVRFNKSDVNRPAELLPGEYAALSVTDTGSGMTDESKAHVFEPFFASSTHGKGAGLGLAACFEIVKRSGGGMTVQSEIDVGTVFKVFLPLVPDTPDRACPPPTKALAGTESILLTDDDDAVRQVAARILQHQFIAHDVDLVQKPFSAESLGRKVRDVLDAPPREAERHPERSEGSAVIGRS